MKKNVLLVLVMATAISALSASADVVTLKDKTLTYQAPAYMAGQVIPLGVDPYGYNYQAHSFSGSFFNVYANGDGFPAYNGDDVGYLSSNPTVTSHWAWPYRHDQVAMKWNEAWLSNSDANGDGKLDRHLGFPSYIGSGAWVNNHQSGSYELGGIEYYWNYFVKIVAVPADATDNGSMWYQSSGSEIGPIIWGEFAVTQEVYNDAGTGAHGASYVSPSGPGVGKY